MAIAFDAGSEAISLSGVGALDVFGSTSQNPSSGGGSDAINLTVAVNAWIISTIKENAGTTITWTNATEPVASANIHMAYGGPFTGSKLTTAAYVGPTHTAMISASFTEAGGGFLPARGRVGMTQAVHRASTY